jgi:ethanolamine ammonia-lyase large subunit
VPGSDDIMLNYQTTSFHDALYARRVLGLKPTPECEIWLRNMGIIADKEIMTLSHELPNNFARALARLS